MPTNVKCQYANIQVTIDINMRRKELSHCHKFKE